jgi:ABC-type antimicrobial peptide transport system, permease component
MIFASILSTLGVNMWQMSSSNVKAFQAAFTTIGTVEQKRTVLTKEEEWDAIEQTTMYYYRANYNAPIPLSLLNFKGADYIYKPEKRPFYGAYLPEYELLPPNTHWGMIGIIIEFTVDKDCVPDHAIEINVKKQLYARYPINTSTVWFCDRYNPKPDKLYAGKTYVMAMGESYQWTDESSLRSVFTPADMIGSVQYSEDGTLLPDETHGILYEEVTDGFYQTEQGKRWLELAKNMERPFHTVPVTPTNNTKLLLPFYNGTSYVKTGKDISAEEYAKGDKVCLVSGSFARRNNLKIGDKITLPLYYANYRDSAGGAYGKGDAWINFNLLNAQGKAYPIFYKADYTIVGQYISVGGENYSGYTLAGNEIIIPTKSVRASDKDNIVGYGPMKGYTTSFQIPNGSIEKYQKAFNKLGRDDLDITFYDKGYTKLKAGLDNVKNMAFILFAAGLLATILILAFFCNLFIAKQKKRTAIERSLGISKWKCTYSMISGVILIVLIGSMIGSILGFFLTNTTADAFSGQSYYNTEYTTGSISNDASAQTVIEYAHPVFAFSVVTWISIVFLAFLLSYSVVTSNLRCEPLELLSEKTQ